MGRRRGSRMARREERPAFYALAPGGWRDYLTLLHPPYTAWHLSYVAIGAAAAPRFSGTRLAATVVAFFLAVGLAAHALDELRGRPLRTRIPDAVLRAIATIGLGGAVDESPIREAPEGALRVLALALSVLAGGLVVARLG